MLTIKEKQKILEIAQTTKTESKTVDFKEKFDPVSQQEWSKIIKDIVAIANSGGGIILFGVKDNGSYAGFDQNIISSIDPAEISDKISSYTNEDFSDFEITEINRKNKKIAALIISATPTPLVFTKPGADTIDGGKQRPIFVRGSVYFRHGAKSEPGTTNDIRITINRVISFNRKSWFQGIRKIANIKSGDEVIVSYKSETQKIPVKIVTDKNAQSFRPDNAQDLWPHREKELTSEINKALVGKKSITPHDIRCVKKQHDINETTRPDFVYKPYTDISPRYSPQFAHWIIYEFKRSSDFFEKAREYFKKYGRPSVQKKVIKF